MAYEPDSLPTDPFQVAQRNWDAYERARDHGHLDYVRDARKFDEYYYGEQWEPEVKNTLNEQKRPHQTINFILSTVNAIMGEYTRIRQEITVRPVDADATGPVASSIAKVLRNIAYDSKYKYEEKTAFHDGVVQDRGFLDVRLDFHENMLGEIKVKAIDPLDVLIDPGAREYDPSTWNEVFVTRWMTPDEIAVMNPEIAENLKYVSAADTYGIDSVFFGPETFSGEQDWYRIGQALAEVPDEAKRIMRIRVIERQYWVLTPRLYFVDPQTGDKSPVPDEWAPERIQAVVQTLGLMIIQQNERRVRWTLTADRYVIKDEWSPYDWFTVVPFFPYFRRGRPFGVVRNLISPQDVLNKVTSQELHVVNTTANSGWMVKTGTLANMNVNDLEQVGAQTGLVLEYQGDLPPMKIQPNQIPSGLDRISQKSAMYFRDISGVSNAMLGMPGREISGKALESKRESNLVQLNTVFDNLELTRQLIGERMLSCIQKFYTEPRILRLMSTGEEGEEQEEVLQLNMMVANRIVNDVTMGEYDIRITSNNEAENADELLVEQLIRMREVGVMIPDWAIVEASPLENRKEIADYIRRMQGALEPTPEEIQKAQMMQELEMRAAMANVAELEAKARERLAHAEKLMAEAQAAGADTEAKVMQAGVELRKELEAMAGELAKSRSELATRLAISREKNATERYLGELQAWNKRLDTQMKERQGSTRAGANVSASRGLGKGRK